jgi:3-hydroxyisobutyrate dehydrogenase-like beta-hydroxyacid dehydrogenase
MQDAKNAATTESVLPTLAATRVGVIGLGRMGHVFAKLLMAGGVHVIAYDIDRDRVQRIVREGATPASSVGDFTECELVLTSLPDDDAVRAVVLSESGLASFLRPGSTHLSARHDWCRLLPGT